MDSSAKKHTNNKLVKRLQHLVGKAIADFNMIEHGDRVMVCLSGGKDSYSLLTILRSLQHKAPIDFELFVVNLDQKQPGFPEHVLPEYLSEQDLEFHIIEEDTYSIVKDKIPEGKTTCSLCSRLRRGVLYRTAKDLGATKIALGHHMDDMVETLFLNMFHGARLKSMPPKLLSDNREHVVIRPLAYCRESELARFSDIQNYPIIPCNLCGSQDNLQRQMVKKMLNDWDQAQPGRVMNVFKSLARITPSHLFDSKLYDFAELSAAQDARVHELDTAFDESAALSLIQKMTNSREGFSEPS